MAAKIFYRLTLLIALSIASLSANAEYTFADLGAGFQAKALNDVGNVAGLSNGNVALWSNGATTVFNLPGTSVASINNVDQIVGNLYTQVPNNFGPSYIHAMLWSNGEATDLGTLGRVGVDSNASAINDAGAIAGWSVNNDGNLYATRNSSYALEPLAGFISSYSTGINSSGQIVGASTTFPYGSGNATLWDGNIAINLGVGLANAINDTGLIVGQSNSYATLWNGFTQTNLGSLGGSSSSALAINNSGLAVGWSLTSSSAEHATLWNGTTAIDLNSLVTLPSGFLTRALAINNLGQILANSSNGQSYLLTSVAAVPEIDTNVMLLIGLGLYGFIAKRRNV